MSPRYPLGSLKQGSNGDSPRRCIPFGEVTEWPKVHDWKSCVGLSPTVGSNPTLSARNSKAIRPLSLRLSRVMLPIRRGARVVEWGGLENR